MGRAIHINYDSKAITEVSGVSGYRLVISKKVSPSTENDLKGGNVFRTNTASELKTFLTALLTAISTSGTNNSYAYVDQHYDIGDAYQGHGEAFYHNENGTSHVTVRRFLKAYAASPRHEDFSWEANLDGKYNEASTDAKTFYDALLAAKNNLP